MYVLLHRSSLDHLTLNAVLNRRRACPSPCGRTPAACSSGSPCSRPGATCSNGSAAAGPGESNPTPSVRGGSSRSSKTGNPTTLFLRDDQQPPPAELDPVAALLTAQDESEEPIQLVPVICVWDRAPEGTGPAVRDFLLGSRERPSTFTKLRSLYSPQGNRPFVQVGEPVNLAEFNARIPSARRRESLRTLLRRYLKREGRVVRGPHLAAAHGAEDHRPRQPAHASVRQRRGRAPRRERREHRSQDEQGVRCHRGQLQLAGDPPSCPGR